jgi:citrate lyase subunit beta/citryl-CoA lyase
MRSPRQFEHPLVVRAKTRVVAAELANGLVPAHNVSLALKDAVATEGDARRARRDFGFMRMCSVHPEQIRAIVAGMAPDSDEVRQAEAILMAASDVQWGPIEHKSEIHDRATYRYFWSVLQAAKTSGAALSPEVSARFFAGN